MKSILETISESKTIDLTNHKKVYDKLSDLEENKEDYNIRTIIKNNENIYFGFIKNTDKNIFKKKLIEMGIDPSQIKKTPSPNPEVEKYNLLVFREYSY